MEKQKYYYIKQVAAVTGLSKQVIRKWEDRYDAVHPLRLENGYRVYQQDDINLLLQIKEFREQGISTKNAITKAKEFHKSKREINEIRKESLNDYTIQLLEHGQQYNEAGMNEIVKQAYYFYGLEVLLEKVIQPFLREVGHKWELGEWSESQETVASQVIRDFLVQIRRNSPQVEEGPLLLGACLPQERHELPLHIILLKLMLKGWRTMLIGPSPAPGTIERLITTFQPKVVLLSASTTIPFDHDPKLLQELDGFANKNQHIQFYLGGDGAKEFAMKHPPKYIHVTNEAEILL